MAFRRDDYLTFTTDPDERGFVTDVNARVIGLPYYGILLAKPYAIYAYHPGNRLAGTFLPIEKGELRAVDAARCTKLDPDKAGGAGCFA